MGDIADLVSLAYVLIARNGAKRKLTARICADTEKKERNMGQQDCCPIIKTNEWQWGYQGNPSHL